jgi:DNA-binding CsgD family transcriptional regulator
MVNVRTLGMGILAMLLLSLPSIVEFAIGDVPFNAAGIAIEVFETLTMAATILAIVFLVTEVRHIRRDRESLVSDLARSRAESIMWRESATNLVAGARQAIDKQFDAWQFTAAEKDIATLILKGCSHKQIGEIRKSTATTVRQQAQSIYRKSGLNGRSELAAYFLDAILQAPEGAAPPEAALTK